MSMCTVVFFSGPVCVPLSLSFVYSCHLFVHSQFVNCMCRFYIASADLLTREKTDPAHTHTHIHKHFSNSSIFSRYSFYFILCTHATKSKNVCACMNWCCEMTTVRFVICSGGSGIHTHTEKMTVEEGGEAIGVGGCMK